MTVKAMMKARATTISPKDILTIPGVVIVVAEVEEEDAGGVVVEAAADGMPPKVAERRIRRARAMLRDKKKKLLEIRRLEQRKLLTLLRLCRQPVTDGAMDVGGDAGVGVVSTGPGSRIC